MRLLVYLPLALVALWIGYWSIAATVLDRAISGWFDTRAAEGWVANYTDLSVAGFPRRFETTVSDLELADPGTGVAWMAPEFRFTAASARPTTVTAVWPEAQTLASPFERIQITSDEMQGMLAFAPNTGLALQQSDIALAGVGLTSSLGWTAGLTSGILQTELLETGEDVHRIVFQADDVTLAEPVRARLDPAGVLPPEVTTLALEAVVDFDAPLDRFAIEVARPQITALDLGNLQATWGQLELRAAGDLTVDEVGVPTGEIVVKATNWREMLGMAEASGLIPEPLVPTVERGLELLAALSGPPDTIDAPLSFRNGLVTFGPIPLGPAPLIVLR